MNNETDNKLHSIRPVQPGDERSGVANTNIVDKAMLTQKITEKRRI